MVLKEIFDIKDFTASYVAKENKIDNTVMTATVFADLTDLHGLLWKVKKFMDVKYNKSVTLFTTSVYRCKELNTLIKGAKNSQHLTGEAADVQPISITINQFFEALKEMAGKCEGKFGQVIKEYGEHPESEADDWIHISLPNKDHINQFMIKEYGQAYRLIE